MKIVTKRFILKIDIQHIFFAFVGFIIVLYILYIRLILKRAPRDMFLKVTWTRFIIYLGLFILFYILTFVLAKNVYTQWYFNKYHVELKENSNWLFFKLKELSLIFVGFIQTCQEEIDYVFKNLVIKKLFKIRLELLVPWLNKIYDKYLEYFHIDEVKISRQLLICFVILPRIVILSALLIDTILYEKFHYFYLCGPLFLTALFYSYFRNSFTNICKDQLDKFNKDLDIYSPYTKKYMKVPEFVSYRLEILLRMKKASCIQEYVGEGFLIHLTKKGSAKYSKDPNLLEIWTDEIFQVYLKALYRLGEMLIQVLCEQNKFLLGINFLFTIVWGYISIRCGLILWTTIV